MVEATEGEFEEVWMGRRLVGGIGGWVELGVWQILRMLSAWEGELGLFRILLMIRPASWVDGVTLHVGAVLHEDILAKDWGFSLTLVAREVLGNLLVERAWVSEVKVWSKFGSEIRSELGLEFRSEFELALEGGAVDFSVAEADSESEINLSESELISFSPEVKRAIAGGSSIEGSLFRGFLSASGVFTGGDSKWVVGWEVWVVWGLWIMGEPELWDD